MSCSALPSVASIPRQRGEERLCGGFLQPELFYSGKGCLDCGDPLIAIWRNSPCSQTGQFNRRIELAP